MPSPTSRPPGGLTIGQALALGAVQGPAELLPISSSGHVALLPWLLGWESREHDPELRKSFEVALHAGTAAALLITLQGEVRDTMAGMNRHRVALIGLAAAPPAAAGYLLERPIERHLGTPATIAGGLLAGSAAMAWTDRAPQTRSTPDSTVGDALLLGLAQACALVPGVSRNGATLAAARRRGFTRADANRLSRHVALPVILGASLLKTVRLYRRGLAPGTGAVLAAGAAAAFGSTLGSTWLIRQVERDRSLLPYAAYRTALAAVVLARLGGRRGPAGPGGRRAGMRHRPNPADGRQ